MRSPEVRAAPFSESLSAARKRMARALGRARMRRSDPSVKKATMFWALSCWIRSSTESRRAANPAPRTKTVSMLRLRERTRIESPHT
jgi:hypothetical protein